MPFAGREEQRRRLHLLPLRMRLGLRLGLRLRLRLRLQLLRREVAEAAPWKSWREILEAAVGANKGWL